MYVIPDPVSSTGQALIGNPESHFSPLKLDSRFRGNDVFSFIASQKDEVVKTKKEAAVLYGNPQPFHIILDILKLSVLADRLLRGMSCFFDGRYLAAPVEHRMAEE